MSNTNISIYPEKNQDITIRWVVEYTDKNGNQQKLFKESEDKANKVKSELETQNSELNELINDEDGGLIHGDQPPSVGAPSASEITSKSTTDDYVNMTRQGMSRAMMYRKFYGEGIEDENPKPKNKPRTRVSPIGGADVKFLSRNHEITEVDKTAEALGSIYAQSTDPLDFERKAKLVGYDDKEITARQERFFRKTSEDQRETHNPKIPLEEIDIIEDVITNKTQRNDIVRDTRNQQISKEYSIPYYDQLKKKNPLLARKLIYLIDIIKRDNVQERDKAAIIWQFLNGVGISDLNPGDKNYIIKFLQNGQ